MRMSKNYLQGKTTVHSCILCFSRNGKENFSHSLIFFSPPPPIFWKTGLKRERNASNYVTCLLKFLYLQTVQWLLAACFAGNTKETGFEY